MTDREAAQAAGLNPETAAYTKSKPRVRDYMQQHRANQQQQEAAQQAEQQHRLNVSRERILERLWQLANMPPEMTRGSITHQVKALSMIIAIEGMLPDHRAAARQPAPPPPAPPQIWRPDSPREQEQDEANQPTRRPSPGEQTQAPLADHEPVPSTVETPPYPPARPAGESAPNLLASEPAAASSEPSGPGFSYLPINLDRFSLNQKPLWRR